jgi:hypothetical protein
MEGSFMSPNLPRAIAMALFLFAMAVPPACLLVLALQR